MISLPIMPTSQTGYICTLCRYVYFIPSISKAKRPDIHVIIILILPGDYSLVVVLPRENCCIFPQNQCFGPSMSNEHIERLASPRITCHWNAGNFDR